MFQLQSKVVLDVSRLNKFLNENPISLEQQNEDVAPTAEIVQITHQILQATSINQLDHISTENLLFLLPAIIDYAESFSDEPTILQQLFNLPTISNGKRHLL